MQLLIVEDDEALAGIMSAALAREGFSPVTVQTARDALHRLTRETWDVVLLDLGLPDGHGLDVLRRLRAVANTIPVVVLSGDDGLEVKLVALSEGADDYLVKPVTNQEIAARLAAVCRRNRRREVPPLQAGALELDPISEDFKLAGRRLYLPEQERLLLKLLFEQRGGTVNYSRILKELYPDEDPPSPTIVRVLASKLRRRFKEMNVTSVRIKSDWGTGYVLVHGEPPLQRPPPRTRIGKR